MPLNDDGDDDDDDNVVVIIDSTCAGPQSRHCVRKLSHSDGCYIIVMSSANTQVL